MSSGENEDFVILLMGYFPGSLATMHAALQRRDFEALSSEGHKLRGACVQIGVVDIAESCQAIEDTCHHRQLDDAVHALRSLEDRIEALAGRLAAKGKSG